MSLITICQGVAASLSIPVPTAVVGATDANAVLLFQLAKQEGRQLMRRHDWQALIATHTITTVATVPQSSSIPTDFDRFLPYTQMWNTSLDQTYGGPADPLTWQTLNNRAVTLGAPGYWILRAGAVNIYPAPTASESVVYDYVSKNYCESSGGTDQSDWAADADVGRVPEHLIELGIIWRWLRAKGMDYAEEMATYDREVEKAAARDRGPSQAMVAPVVSSDIDDATWQGTITEV